MCERWTSKSDVRANRWMTDGRRIEKIMTHTFRGPAQAWEDIYLSWLLYFASRGDSNARAALVEYERHGDIVTAPLPAAMGPTEYAETVARIKSR
jgi:hypothetical protein